MFWMFMTALWVLMLVAPLALLVALLPSGRECPRCGGETILLRSRLLGALRRRLGRRWCTACGWEGMMRYSPQPTLVPTLDGVREEHDDAAWRAEHDGNAGF